MIEHEYSVRTVVDLASNNLQVAIDLGMSEVDVNFIRTAKVRPMRVKYGFLSNMWVTLPG